MKTKTRIYSQVTRLVIRLLQETFPPKTVDLQWNDASVRRMVCEDFMFYLRVLWCAFDDEKLYRKLDVALKSGEDFQMLIKTWLSEWTYQWLKRVKIRFDDLPFRKKPGQNLPVPANLFGEMQEASIISLINHKALCGLAPVSKAIVKRVFNLLSKKQKHMPERNWKVLLLTTVCRESRLIAKSTGPLLFIKPNKHYFQFYHKDS